LRFMVTAGPTREAIDDVRFLSNRSSGKMGYAIARELKPYGDVTLVSGPVSLKTPKGINLLNIESARQLARVVGDHAGRVDCIVMCAAVADYRPEKSVRGKIRKAGPMTLKLVRNPDILAQLGRMRKRPVLIGFALESEDKGVSSARRKLADKNLDAIVLNYLNAVTAECSTGEIIVAGEEKSFAFNGLSKRALAKRIASLAAGLVRKR